MFAALSRLTKPGDKKSCAPAPMSSSLQKKFARGVNYNMKILIKGDRSVGKSCLLQRLQGGLFIEEYRPTDQIQVAPIHWTYKTSDHIVKVEVWEVVDKGRTKKRGPTGLKLDNLTLGSATDTSEPPPLDATFLDVYKNANGVILMMDITKPWTFDYVQREIAGIPSDIPVIILGNHCDMNHHRQVHSHQIEQVVTNAKETRSGSVRYAEASMRNGFGLRLLHRFLSIPFLQLQRATLLAQLSTNQQETEHAHVELDEFQNSEESDYGIFLERLAAKRKESVAVGIPRLDKSPSIVLGGGRPIIPPNVNPLASTHLEVSPNKPFLGPIQSPTVVTSPAVKLSTKGASPLNSYPSKPNVKQDTTKENHISPIPVGRTDDDLEDFCSGVLDHSFLDDMSPGSRGHTDFQQPYSTSNRVIDSDSDGENGANPLVVAIPDDLDSASEEEIEAKPYMGPTLNLNTNENITKTISKTAKVLQLNTNISANSLTKTFVSSEKVFTPYEEGCKPLDILEAPSDGGSLDNHTESIFGKLEKFSMYEDAKDEGQSDEDHYDNWPEFAPPTYGYSSIRRSPEGGEDVSPDAELKKEKKPKEEKKHKKSKKSKDKEKDRSSDKEKKKDKDKEKRHREKKLKKKGSEEYLEEFLNGSTADMETGQEAYETL